MKGSAPIVGSRPTRSHKQARGCQCPWRLSIADVADAAAPAAVAAAARSGIGRVEGVVAARSAVYFHRGASTSVTVVAASFVSRSLWQTENISLIGREERQTGEQTTTQACVVIARPSYC